MFLDKAGKKISKSKGNVLTPQMWLEYGTSENHFCFCYISELLERENVSIDYMTFTDGCNIFTRTCILAMLRKENQIKLAKIRVFIQGT